jgi:hypothetical protein
MISPPRELRAALPAELRGLRRDGARLCVVERAAGRITHTIVARMGEHLAAGASAPTPKSANAAISGTSSAMPCSSSEAPLSAVGYVCHDPGGPVDGLHTMGDNDG